MGSYYRAPALTQLVNELNARHPGRDRTSDGWIGDAAHAARRSDHNPDPVTGVVRAQDIDKDGINVNELLNALLGDDRVANVIFNAQWAGPTTGWAWRPYTGINAHRAHIHVSVRHGADYENDTRPWFGASAVSNPGPGTGGGVVVPDITPPAPLEETLSWGYIPPNAPSGTPDAYGLLTAAASRADSAHRTASTAVELVQATRADVQRSDAITRDQLNAVVETLGALTTTLTALTAAIEAQNGGATT